MEDYVVSNMCCWKDSSLHPIEGHWSGVCSAYCYPMAHSLLTHRSSHSQQMVGHVWYDWYHMDRPETMLDCSLTAQLQMSICAVVDSCESHLYQKHKYHQSHVHRDSSRIIMLQ